MIIIIAIVIVVIVAAITTTAIMLEAGKALRARCHHQEDDDHPSRGVSIWTREPNKLVSNHAYWALIYCKKLKYRFANVSTTLVAQKLRVRSVAKPSGWIWTESPAGGRVLS